MFNVKGGPISFIESMTQDNLGTILRHLNGIIGTQKVVNRADIRVAMKYAFRLARTSKRMYNHINSTNISHVFIESICCRFRQPYEEIAALYNTLGARVKLWEYIHKRGDYFTYLAIKEIHELGYQILVEAKEEGLITSYPEKNVSCPPPHSFPAQTETGMKLYLTTYVPLYIITPFGKIDFLHSYLYPHYSVSEAFIHRLNAKFQSCDNNAFYGELEYKGLEKIRKIFTDNLKYSPPKEFLDKKGTQNLIISRFSLYNINQVGNLSIPEVTYNKPLQRSKRLIERIWELLEANGPLTKKKMPSIEKVDQEPQAIFREVSEVAEYYVNIVKRLEKYPRFMEVEFSTAQFLHVLHNVSKSFYNSPLSLNFISRQIEITSKSSSCDLNLLKNAYSKVLELISINWKFSRLKDFTNLANTHSEEEFCLYIKTHSLLNQENYLITLLSEQMGISKYLTCGFFRENDHPIKGALYLWIRKKELEVVAKTLKLAI